MILQYNLNTENILLEAFCASVHLRLRAHVMVSSKLLMNYSARDPAGSDDARALAERR